MNRLLQGTLCLIACAVLSGQATAAPLIVDTFATPSTPFLADAGDPGNGSFGPTSGAGILGSRTVTYNRTPVGNFGTAEAIEVGGGVLLLGTQSSAVEVGIAYSGFGSLDLTGYSDLELVFLPLFDDGIPDGSFTLDVALSTSTGVLSTSLIIPTAFTSGTLSIPLSGLTGPGNLGSVTGISIALNDGGSPVAAADFTLDEIRLQPIPEPGSIALWSVVGLAGAWYGRRRLKNTQTAR